VLSAIYCLLSGIYRPGGGADFDFSKGRYQPSHGHYKL